eukprot:1149064-Pelagomonas_calceolata.AAC.2
MSSEMKQMKLPSSLTNQKLHANVKINVTCHSSDLYALCNYKSGAKLNNIIIDTEACVCAAAARPWGHLNALQGPAPLQQSFSDDNREW